MNPRDALRQRRERRRLERFAVACLRLDALLQQHPDGPSRYGTLAVAATELLEHGWVADDLHDLAISAARPRPWPTVKARDAGADIPEWVDDASPLATDVEQAALELRAN
ncbi:hypothetical protein [Curtobacterium sp. MCSS17_016]|uniref:hypothetical protein n=1 Tax=Curtobacterium sp. MCSS17_016 TaxID=2175644 RepID=UPI000DA7CD84|nr:hypothetical protein [Curtobacterium sp. MCSS17_016]WIE81013.1 hypothetical protein DEJ19_021085 [Curtobacterium sp. MCSS17_016]